MRNDTSWVDWHNPYRRTGGMWRKGDLHTHTIRSRDGSLSEEALVRGYESIRYQFIALTDHNLVSTGSHPPADLVVFEGLEADFEYLYHTNVIHLSREMIRRESSWDHQTFVNENAARGCLVILNHPNWGPCGHFTVKRLLETANYDGIEIYNSGCEGLPGSPQATAEWDRLLSRGRRFLGFCNGDVHISEHLRGCCNVVRSASGAPSEIFHALKQGGFYCCKGVEITELGRRGDAIHVSTTNAISIRFIADEGRVVAEVPGRAAEFSFRRSDACSYVRVECRGVGQQISWTQPFFRD